MIIIDTVGAPAPPDPPGGRAFGPKGRAGGRGSENGYDRGREAERKKIDESFVLQIKDTSGPGPEKIDESFVLSPGYHNPDNHFPETPDILSQTQGHQARPPRASNKVRAIRRSCDPIRSIWGGQPLLEGNYFGTG